MKYKYIIRVLGLIILIPFLLFVTSLMLIINLLLGDFEWRDLIDVPLGMVGTVEQYLATGEV